MKAGVLAVSSYLQEESVLLYLVCNIFKVVQVFREEMTVSARYRNGTVPTPWHPAEHPFLPA